MTHCSTHHAFPVPLSSSPAARCPCGLLPAWPCPAPQQLQLHHPAPGEPFLCPRFMHLPSPLPVTQRLHGEEARGVVLSWGCLAEKGGTRPRWSQESGVPAVPVACCRILGLGRRPAPAAHRTDPRQEEQRSPPGSLILMCAPAHPHAQTWPSTLRPPRSPPRPQFPLSDPFTCPACGTTATPQGVGAPRGATCLLRHCLCHQDLGDRERDGTASCLPPLRF